MARRKRKRDSAKNRALLRTLRSIIAIIVLSAFVLGISYSIKQLSTLDINKIAALSGHLLGRFGVGDSQVGEVAGKFIDRISKAGGEIIDKVEDVEERVSADSVEEEVGGTVTPVQEENLLFAVAIFADSHITADPVDYKANADYLKKAIDLSKARNVKSIFHVGDITNLGVVEDLRNAQDILDSSGKMVYVLPGDRDLWQSVGLDNFDRVFGDNFHSVSIKGYKFVLLDNSANYTKIDDNIMSWFKDEVNNADYVVASQPLYTQGLSYPFSMMYMGSTPEAVQNEEMFNLQEEVRVQREELLSLIRESKVRAVIAGDHHRSSAVGDGEKDDLKHYVVGAVATKAMVLDQKLLQPSSFGLLKVYEDGSYKIENVLLE